MPAVEVQSQVIEALEDCQKSFATHKRCMLRMKQAQQSDPKKFKQTLFACLNRAMLIFRREPAVERLLHFIASFVSFSNDKYQSDGELAVELLDRMVPLTGARDKAVRFRSCQLTSKLLNSLGEDAEVSEELFESILQAMLTRLNDKVPVVRVHAAAALARLQDPTDADDSVTSEYMRMVGSDTSKEVRKAVLANMGVSSVTLQNILDRARDVREDVRKYTFNVIAIKIDVKALQVSQRVTLLGQGLQDRSDVVRKACREMVSNKWLPRCEGDPLALLKLLDVELHPSECELALGALVEDGRLADIKSFLPGTGSGRRVGAEEAFYWRVVAQLAVRNDNDDLMEASLPGLLDFCGVLRGNLADVFVTAELLKLVPLLDLGEEVGRKRLMTLLGALLLDLDTPEALVSGLMGGLAAMEETPEELSAFTVASIQTLRAQSEQEEGAVALRGLGRCLSLAADLLRRFNNISQVLRAADEVKELAEGAMRLPDAELRRKAVEVLGLFGVLDQVVAGSYQRLFLNVLKHDVEVVRATALSSMLDALLLFPRANWAQPPPSLLNTLSSSTSSPQPEDAEKEDPAQEGEGGEEEEGREPVLEKAFACVFDESPIVRAVAVEGFAKLLMAGRLRGAGAGAEGGGLPEKEALVTLLLALFHPATEEDTHLRQCLSVLFPCFARHAPRHANLLAQALPALVQSLVRVPTAAPFGKGGGALVGQYVLSLLDDAPESAERHGEAAGRRAGAWLLDLLLADPLDSAKAKAVGKLLGGVRVTKEGGKRGLAELLEKGKEVEAHVGEAGLKKAVEKLLASVKEAMEGEGEEGEEREGEGEGPFGAEVRVGAVLKGFGGEEAGEGEAPRTAKKTRARGGARKRADKDEDEDEEGDSKKLLSPHSPLVVRRSARVSKPVRDIKNKETEIERRLREEEARQEAESSSEEEEEEDEEDEEEDSHVE